MRRCTDISVRRWVTLLFVSLTLQGGAQTPGILARLLSIAEPDQVQAYSRLHLSQEQSERLNSIAESYLPTVLKYKAEPAQLALLVPEAWARVEAVLTPEQRPLARKLLPRPHQWAKLRELYNDL